MAEARYPIPAPLAGMDRGRHQVIEASAGTGKTFLLEHCVVDLLVAGAATIDQVAVVTFTEKATAELKRRVRRLIETVGDAAGTVADGQPAWILDEPARDRLRDALTAFDRAQISTIHAFCQRVLTENAFSNRRLFAQTQVASEAAFREAFRGELRRQLARDADDAAWLQTWLESGDHRTIDGLGKLLHRCSELGGRLAPPFEVDRLVAAADAVDEAALDGGRVLAALRAARVNAATARAIADRVDVLAGALAGWRQHRQPARLLAAIDEHRGGKLIRFVDDLIGHAAGIAALADLSVPLRALVDALVPLDAAVVQRFLPRVQARARRDKDRLGQFDFRDMLELVWHGLQGADGDALAARLRRRWPHALVDEFQDTDEVQWRIFRRVWLDEPGGRLTIIGDPKQAIYGFRAADVHTYLAASREMEQRGGQRTVIRDSWRSTPDMVAALNALFVDDGADSLFDPDGPIRCADPLLAAAPVVARDAGGAPTIPVHLVDLGGGKRNADDLRRGHLRFLVDEIDALLNDPARRLEVGVPGAARPEDQPRPVREGDIFVLTRASREAEQVADALRAAGIRCALYQQEGLLQTAEAAEVRDLLQAIADPGDRPARLRAWRTRFFCAGLGDLPDLQALPETHPWVARLYEWKALADRLDYESLFSAVVAGSSLVERELFRRGGERGITNVIHLFELLLDEVLRARCEIHELIARLGAWMSDDDGLTIDERNIQRLESERDAVQVMTIHKSKGLQAPVVFLYGGFLGAQPGSTRVYHAGGERLIHVGPDGPEAARVEEAREDQRLLYVALTRAVGRLYLPRIDGRVQKCTGVLAALQRRIDRLLDRMALGDRDLPAQLVLRAPGGDPAGAPALQVVPPPWTPPAALLAPPPPDGELDAIRRRSRGASITSYTRLSAGGAWGTVIDRAELESEVDASTSPLPEHVLPAGAATGIFLHEALELVDPAGLVDAGGLDAWRERPEVARLFGELGARHGIAARHLAHAQQLVFDALGAPVGFGGQLLPAIAGCDRILREVEFLYPAADGRVHATGVIDLIIEHDGRVYLLDWKSDLLDDYGAAALERHVHAHYQLQSRLYALALVKLLGAAAAERFAGVAYLFLRGRAGAADPAAAIHFERPPLAALDELAHRLAAMGGAP